MKVYGECLDLLTKHRLSFAYARCDKQALRRYTNPMHPHEIAFWLALERIGLTFKNRNSLGFIVADESMKSIKQSCQEGSSRLSGRRTTVRTEGGHLEDNRHGSLYGFA